MNRRDFARARDTFLSGFQPKEKRRLLYIGDNSGAVDTGDPETMWAHDGAGNIERIRRGGVTPLANMPILVGDTVGYSSSFAEAKEVFTPQISSYQGATFRSAYVGSPNAIAYAGTDGNLTSDYTLFRLDLTNDYILFEGDASSALRLTGCSDTSGINPHILGKKGRGTLASPTAALLDDVLLRLSAQGYGATTFGSSSTGRIDITADENQTDATRATRFDLWTTPAGSITPSKAVTIDSDGTLQPLKAFALPGDLTPPQLTADQNDYAPTGHAAASVFRLDSDAARTITGLAGGADGRIVFVHYIGANSVILANENAGSSAANRFALSGAITLTTDSVCVLQYDSTSSRWRGVSGGGGSSASSGDLYRVIATGETKTIANGYSIVYSRYVDIQGTGVMELAGDSAMEII